MIQLINEYGRKSRGYLKKIGDNLWEFDPEYLELFHRTDGLKEPCLIDRDGLIEWLEKFETCLKEKNSDADNWMDLKFTRNTGDVQFNCLFLSDARKPEFPWRVSYKTRNSASRNHHFDPDDLMEDPRAHPDLFHSGWTATSEEHIRTYMAEIQAEIDAN